MQQQTFIYGDFRFPPAYGKLLTRGLPPFPPALSRPNEPSIGIEVLREYGPSELRGKIYSWQVGGWAPMQPSAAQVQPWYLVFKQYPKFTIFEMQSSGAWEILYFRQESDSNGSYMAVALKYLPEAPEWLSKIQKSPTYNLNPKRKITLEP
jgi:hypothetical protein